MWPVSHACNIFSPVQVRSLLGLASKLLSGDSRRCWIIPAMGSVAPWRTPLEIRGLWLGEKVIGLFISFDDMPLAGFNLSIFKPRCIPRFDPAGVSGPRLGLAYPGPRLGLAYLVLDLAWRILVLGLAWRNLLCLRADTDTTNSLRIVIFKGVIWIQSALLGQWLLVESNAQFRISIVEQIYGRLTGP